MGLEQQLADVQAAVEALTQKFTSVDKATKQLDRLRKRIQAAKRRAANAEERAAEAYWSAYQDQKAAAEMRARDAIQEQLEQIAAEERGAMAQALHERWVASCAQFNREEERIVRLSKQVEHDRRQLRSMESEMETARRWLAFVHEAISAEESHLECIKAEVAAASAPTERYATVLQQTAQAAAARIISDATRRANDIVAQALSKSAPQPVTAERRTP